MTIIINLMPQRRDDTLAVSVAGDVLTVNGTDFDFGGLPEGATLPGDAIDSDHFCGPVERIDGVLHVAMLLPHGRHPTPEEAFPAPIAVTADGPVALPQPAPVEPEPVEPEITEGEGDAD